ncbi:MAG: GspE/PulE family protein [Patescibacteria group bacterium]
MSLSAQELSALLVDSGFLTAEQLQAALNDTETNGGSIEETLIRTERMTDDEVSRLFADAYGVKLVDLRKTEIDPEAVKGIAEIVAKKQQVISYGWKNGKRQLALVDPRNVELISLLQKKFGEELEIAYTSPASLNEGLTVYSSDTHRAVGELAEKLQKQGEAAVSRQGSAAQGLLIQMVQNILEYGYDNNASDIHIEPHEKQLLVRYRIDGVLHDVFHLSKALHELVVARIKILSNLRTDEHFAAQDGKFRAFFSGVKTDIRVSILPIVEGEKIVLRLLSERGRTFTLESLGFANRDLEKVKAAAEKPYGMILSTGPTGSGKTTSMYAVLKILNQRDVNIATIEDPVEYDIDGVNQIQVNNRTNLTFAAGLRSIVRQDPDIIMVGEIRDAETANISVNAAMTGHLVLSTLHTNDAATALPRLVDMEVEPFLIASSVNVIIAQRLVRHICKSCITSQDLDLTSYKRSIPAPLLEKYFGAKESVKGFYGKGCKVCHQSGFVGRLGIFEVLEVSDKIRELITARANAAEITKVAIAEGMTTMLEDGIRKVTEGVTTLEEIMRVVR